jgi:hypothetical protein
VGVNAEPVILRLAIEANREEAFRHLGYPAGSTGSPRAIARTDALWTAATAALDARGAYAVVGRERALRAGMPAPAALVGVAVCTIGAALEDESARRADAGELLDALVLDAIGSAAAEAAADALNLHLCDIAAERGVEAAPRVSPGYGDWDTAGQVGLLALLPIAELGISLTSGAMMVPRKSVSFAVNMAPAGEAGPHPASRCERCGLVRCRHRVAPQECG